MKKLVWTMLVMCTFLMAGMTAFAGSINEHEQRVLDTVSEPVEYEGKQYKAKDTYIRRLAAYMNQDNVELTSEQADEAIVKFYDNIAAGITEGYMEETGSANSGNGGSTGGNSGNGGTDGNTDNNSGNKDENNESAQENGTDNQIDQITGNEENQTGEATVGNGETVAEAELSAEEIARLQKERALVDSVLEKYSLAEEEADVYAELEESESEMALEAATETENESEEETTTETGTKDYSDAEPYQSGISLGTIAIVIVIVVAVALVGIIFWHRSKSYKR